LSTTMTCPAGATARRRMRDSARGRSPGRRSGSPRSASAGALGSRRAGPRRNDRLLRRHRMRASPATPVRIDPARDRHPVAPPISSLGRGGAVAASALSGRWMISQLAGSSRDGTGVSGVPSMAEACPRARRRDGERDHRSTVRRSCIVRQQPRNSRSGGLDDRLNKLARRCKGRQRSRPAASRTKTRPVAERSAVIRERSPPPYGETQRAAARRRVFVGYPTARTFWRR
jgi:hypothetical protein